MLAELNITLHINCFLNRVLRLFWIGLLPIPHHHKFRLLGPMLYRDRDCLNGFGARLRPEVKRQELLVLFE